MSIESLLSGLTPSEKLDAMDFFWRDLTRDPSQYASPAWHKRVLADRLANPAEGAKLPLGDAKDDVKERLRDHRTQGAGLGMRPSIRLGNFDNGWWRPIISHRTSHL